MYETFLNGKESDKLFSDNAIFIHDEEVIPFYKIKGIFGEWASDFLQKLVTRRSGGYNAWGEYSPGRPIIYYLTRGGFYKVVMEHNYRLMVAETNGKEVTV